MHLLLTGPPGVGKSTVVQRVLERLAAHTPTPTSYTSTSNTSSAATIAGFWTEEVRCSSSGERCGFDVVTVDGRRGVLARVGSAHWGAPQVGKYVVDVAAFEALALPALLPHPGTRLVIIDEVGKMELCSAAFYPAVCAALDATAAVLGTVPLPRHGRTIPQVGALQERPAVELIRVTRDNRDALVGQLVERLTPALLT